MLFPQIFRYSARDLVVSAALGAVKYVELDVLAWWNRTESARNALCTRENPYVEDMSEFQHFSTFVSTFGSNFLLSSQTCERGEKIFDFSTLVVKKIQFKT